MPCPRPLPLLLCLAALGAASAEAPAQPVDRLLVRLVVGDDGATRGGVWVYVRDRQGALLSRGVRAKRDADAWPANTERTVWVPLARPSTPGDVGSVVIRTRYALGGGAWDLTRVDVEAYPGARLIARSMGPGGARLHRFHREDQLLEVPLHDGRFPCQDVVFVRPVCEVTLRVRTGDDDLRGGGSIEAVIYDDEGRRLTGHADAPRAGPPAVFALYGGQPWPRRSTRDLTVPLREPVLESAIGAVELTYLGAYRGQLAADNWDVDAVEVWANGRPLWRHTGRPLHRFTGGDQTVLLPAPSRGPVSQLQQVVIRVLTGDDDLRARSRVWGQVFDAQGRPLSDRADLNERRRWGDRSTHSAVIRLNRPAPRSEVRRVVLTFEPGSSAFQTGDNWNVDRVDVLDAPGGGSLHSRPGRPLKRFTGDDRVLDLRW